MGSLDRIFRSRVGQERPLAAIVAGLWRNGEQGAWYDPSDLRTMFQDAAGTLPCYMPGQGQVDPPVGLLLDKRLGFALGPERITNTGFQTLDGWTAVRGASATVSGGAVTVTTANPQDWGSVSTPIATEPGKTYLVKVLMTSGNGQNVQLLVSESAVNHVNITNTGSARNAVGYYSLVFKATKTVHYVWLGSSTNTASVGVSSWVAPTVREISANYAFQATTTSRPTLSARYNLLTNTPFAGAVVGAPGTAPTGWTFGFATGEITAVTPLGPDFAIQIATSATRLIFTQQLTAAPNVAYSHWIDVLETTAITAINFIALTAPPSGATMTYWFNGEPITSSTVISSPGRLEMRMLVGSTGGSYYVRFGVGCSGNTTGVATIARPDVRVTNDGVGLPPYQRVVDANTYDTVGFPLYLRFDGVDDGLTIPGSASAFAFLHNGSGSSVHIGFSPSGGAVYHTLLSSGNLGSGTTVGFSVSQDDRTDGRLLNILNNGSGALHVSQAAVGGISNARRVVSAVNAVGVHELRQGRTIVSPLAVETGSPSQAAASYDLMIGRAPQAGLPLAGRIFGVIIRAGTPAAAQIVAAEKFLSAKARIY